MVILTLTLAIVMAASPPLTPTQQRRIAGLSPLPPLEPDATNAVSTNPQAARLGQQLFFDSSFSSNGKLACATCHDPARAFTDGRALSMGLAQGSRHTPSLINVAHQRWLFWDGRADTLWSQALHPFEHPDEFGSSRLAILHHLHNDAVLKRAYEEVFGSLPDLANLNRFPASGRPGRDAQHPDVVAWATMTEDDQHAIDTAFVNIGKAIAAYEHRLVSGPSPFDLYVRAMVSNDRAGMAAYPEAARRGLLLFVGEAGCRQCHSGPMLSDLEFHNIGVPSLDGTLPDDPGRFEGIRTLQQNPFRANGHFSDEPDSIRARSTQTLLQSSEHWGAFRTPSLRNVARTPPYMHQGQFKTLGEVLAYYNTLDDMVVLDHHQEAVLAPLRLEPQALADLEAFLESLSSPPVEAALGQTTLEILKKPVPDP